MQLINIELLKPYVRNARTHSKSQVKKIGASIKEFGFTNPILLSQDNTIIAGHGRALAAKLLGMREVPCIFLNDLTDAQQKAYVLADNKLALDAGWDADKLKLEFEDLKLAGFNLELTGFSIDEILKIIGSAEEKAEEDTGQKGKKVRVSAGDFWKLGQHTLVCGDSRDAHLVEKLFKTGAPVLMCTDPPYGVNYDPKWRQGLDKDRKAKNTGAMGVVLNDDVTDWYDTYVLFPGDIAYVWSPGLMSNTVFEGLEKAGFSLVSQIIWKKNNFILSRGDYHFQHEVCWYAVRTVRKHNWFGGRDQSTVWEISGEKNRLGHSTQKPVDCMLKPILNNTKEGDIVYDPFLGSGTTLIAAEQSKRVCVGFELSPEYCTMVIDRWEGFTGLKAERETD